MTVRLPSWRMTLAALAAGLVFTLVSPLSDHALWDQAALAENPQGSPAQHHIQTQGEDGSRTFCNEIPEAKGGTLIGYLVPCIIYTIQHTSQAFSEAMIEWLMPTVWAFVTFVMTMFGLKVLQGETEVYKQGFLLLLKIGIVLAVLEMIPSVIIPQLYQVMRETQMVVSTTIADGSGDFHCEFEEYGDENTLPVWKQLDCVLGKLWGFTMGTDGTPSMLLAASVFGLLGGFFFGGTFGVALFVALVGMLWSMFAMVLRTVSTFLNAYLYATIMLLIAPLFLPLTLMKVTSSYFDKWWSSILASLLLPLIITAYVMVAMMIYDKLLFGPNAEINVLFDYANVREAQASPQQACDRQVAGNPTMRSQLSGLAESVLYRNPLMQNFSTPINSAANNMCAGLQLHVLRIRDIESAEYKSEKEGFTELFMHAIKMLIMAMLVSRGFSEVTSYARMMVGSYSASSSVGSHSAQESRFMHGIDEARRGLEAGFGNASGATFVERIPVAARYALLGNRGDPDRTQDIPGFMGGISRSTE